MNPTQQPVKRPLVLPEPIPDTEAERTVEGLHLIGVLKDLTKDWKQELTSWELDVVNGVLDGKACTRVRLTEIRGAVARLRKKFRE
jgi:hypothetical protein